MTEPIVRLERSAPEQDVARNVSHIALQLGKVAMDFAQVKRIPRYYTGERESDVEHSFMLGLVACELAHTLELDLNAGLISQYATVHDLIELKTGDINTFNLSAEQLQQKQFIEKQALHQLIEELPPYTARLVERYEHQTDPEARFVKAVDKILPFIVDIHGEGVRIMQEDNEVLTRQAFLACLDSLHTSLSERFGREFPEIIDAHQVLGELLSHQMPEQPEQDYLFVLRQSTDAHTSS
ncbi:MAG: HD domain-containing protein [Candidatus Saccharimonadales bacterium]